MRGLVSATLLGFLAFVASNSEDKPILTKKNDTESLDTVPKNGAEVGIQGSHSSTEDNSKATSLVRPQIVTPPTFTTDPKSNGFYSFEVPLGEGRNEDEDEDGESSETSANEIQDGRTYREDGAPKSPELKLNNGPDQSPQKSLSNPVQKYEIKPNETNKEPTPRKTRSKSYETQATYFRNETIQKAGTGFHFAQANPPEGLLNHPGNLYNLGPVISHEEDEAPPFHGFEHHRGSPEPPPPPKEHHVLDLPHDLHLHANPHPPPHSHPHPHHHHHVPPHSHSHPHHHQKFLEDKHKHYPKPLKPSIVHRDPHDYYSHHDKVRTIDEDGYYKVHLYSQYPKHVLKEKGHYKDYKGYKDYKEPKHYIGHGKEVYGFEPYDYDMKHVPECAHKNKHFYNLTFCLEDHLYPLETILWALHHQHDLAHKLLSDVTYQSADNLVSGLTRAQEEGYTYKHYFGATHAQHVNLEKYKPPYNGYTYKVDYYKHGGYICPSDIYYGRPRRAMNTYGQWKVIVNVDHVPKPHYLYDHGIHKKREIYYPHKGHSLPEKAYTQTLRFEQCIYPNAPCSYIDPYFHSRCLQKHNFVRLVAWTLEEGLHVDTFKMPIACSCHIPQPIHFYHEAGRHEEHYGKVVPPVNKYLPGDGVK